MATVGSTRDSPARGAAPRPRASLLRQLAAQLPPVDRALDDFIARANQTEIAVSDAEVLSEMPAPDAGTDHRPAVDLERRDALERERSLRDQLVGVLDRLTDVEAREQVQRDQLARLQSRLVDTSAPAAASARTRARRWRAGLIIAGAFAAGLAVMFTVSRLGVGRSDPAPAFETASPEARSTPSAVPVPAAPAPAAPAPAAPAPAAPALAPPAPVETPIAPLPVPLPSSAATVHAAGARPAPGPTAEHAHRVERPPVHAPASPGVPAHTSPLVDPFAEPRAALPAGSPAGTSTPTGAHVAKPIEASSPALPSQPPEPRASGTIVNPF